MVERVKNNHKIFAAKSEGKIPNWDILWRGSTPQNVEDAKGWTICVVFVFIVRFTEM